MGHEDAKWQAPHEEEQVAPLESFGHYINYVKMCQFAWDWHVPADRMAMVMVRMSQVFAGLVIKG